MHLDVRLLHVTQVATLSACFFYGTDVRVDGNRWGRGEGRRSRALSWLQFCAFRITAVLKCTRRLNNTGTCDSVCVCACVCVGAQVCNVGKRGSRKEAASMFGWQKEKEKKRCPRCTHTPQHTHTPTKNRGTRGKADVVKIETYEDEKKRRGSVMAHPHAYTPPCRVKCETPGKGVGRQGEHAGTATHRCIHRHPPLPPPTPPPP